ncbi:MAG: recombinase family protein [Halorhodospira sp.]
MLLRAYLRASTDGQDAQRARATLEALAGEHGHRIASWYAENASGTQAERPELRRLLSDAQPGDGILVESVDRLSRLPAEPWRALRAEIEAKGLRVVAADLPTSHTALTAASDDEFTARMLDAVNGMMLEMMAAIARKDYEQRRERQRQGIEKAKAEGKFQGRPRDVTRRKRVEELLAAGFSVRKAAYHAGVSTYTVQSVKRQGA